MLNFLRRLCPFIVPMTLCMIMYYKIDNHDKITIKISSHLKVNEKWKASCCGCFMLLSIIAIGFIGMFIDIPEWLVIILCGIIAGIGISIGNKLSPNHK